MIYKNLEKFQNRCQLSRYNQLSRYQLSRKDINLKTFAMKISEEMSTHLYDEGYPKFITRKFYQRLKSKYKSGRLNLNRVPKHLRNNT